MINLWIRFCLSHRLFVFILLFLIGACGYMVSPFDWKEGLWPRYPVAVDAIPDIGENQQIILTKWEGRSPQDIEDQITYPLTTTLLGIAGVKTIRSYSFLGFSMIYIIFKDDHEFYWCRSRVLEKLSSLPQGLLPNGIQPTLGPDATALGQIFWYTLEGEDDDGHVTGGWDLHELRSIQDWYVRYALQGVEGVSEVASIGGFMQEYQVDIDPDAMQVYGVSLGEIFKAISQAHVDVGARTIEVNQVEYVIRGLGSVESQNDLEKIVIKMNEDIPLLLKDVARVSYGPALRRGVLDKEGAEVVGGVVIARYGENPLQTIQKIKEKIKEISHGLPQKTLENGKVSHVRIKPFYDRSDLIYETLGTLRSALFDEMIVTIIVIFVSLFHFTSSLLIAILLPLTVFLCFIAMKIGGIEANIVSLSGIAIAIGSIVDMGIIISENILRHMKKRKQKKLSFRTVYQATTEVSSAVLTAVLTTVISFLPIFFMTGAEGKLFKPLAFTKTWTLLGAVFIALSVIPVWAYILFPLKDKWVKGKVKKKSIKMVFYGILFPILCGLLAYRWMPLGVENGLFFNVIFVIGLMGAVLYAVRLLQKNYATLLAWCLDHKTTFLSLPLCVMCLGGMVYWGAPPPLDRFFPGIGREFMPALDEGSYLLMPTTMPHASIGEVMDVLKTQDQLIATLPEVEQVVGKVGRVESHLDPAPLSMIETIIQYKTEYKLNKKGERVRFRYDDENQVYVRDETGELIEDKGGRYYRQWRDHIKKPSDIWDEIVNVSEIPGTTLAPRLQPISARIVMLQSGMRSPMGVKIKGPSLEVIEQVGLQIEKYLKDVPEIQESSVFADRVVGKPYLEIHVDRDKIAHYGISMKTVQNAIEVAVGGKTVMQVLQGRERTPVRVRYLRERRDSIESLKNILLSLPTGAQIPLEQVAHIRYKRGPQAVKSEEGFLISYVLFDKKQGVAELDVVKASQAYLERKIQSGEWVIPKGVSFYFAGNYENQVRASKTLAFIVPLALIIIFLILYFQFQSIMMSLLVFSGIFLAWSGGFLMMWAYGQEWFCSFSWGTFSLRELFQMGTINLSVAVWVGFLMLFGLATDDGVVMLTYLNQSFKKKKGESLHDIRKTIINGAKKRIKPCLMTSSTTILALLPILTSTGRGADIMIPMAIPSFGGMLTVSLLSIFWVPVIYCILKETAFKKKQKKSES